MIEDGSEQRADWPFIKDGAITLFWRRALFNAAKETLRSLDYDLLQLECSTVERFKLELSAALRWEEQFGYSPWDGNLNALDEGVAWYRFPPSSNVALAFAGFHRLVAEDPVTARGLLDVIELQSRNHLAAGRRLIALIQTDDAKFYAGGLGKRSATWNQPEWFDANRLP